MNTTQFWKHMKKRRGCWLWSKALFSTGYGAACVPKLRLAHRIAWELSIGKIPDGMWVLHKCDNKSCCNPKHLFLGTAQDNTNDMLRKGRNRNPKGSKHPRSILNEKSVIHIRKAYASGVAVYTELAHQYGVHSITIGDVIRRETWKHV